MIIGINTIKLGTELKNLRNEVGMTQSNVSALTGVNRDTLRRIENGSVIPKFETLSLLSSAYKVNLFIIVDKFSTNHEINTLITTIDSIIIQESEKDITQYIEKLEEVSLKIEEYTYINASEITQLKILLDVINLYYTGTYDIEVQLSNLKDALQKKESFNWINFNQYSYSFIEYRILLMSSLLFAKNNLTLSTEILQYLYNNMFHNYDFHESEFKLQIKILYNLSYNYYKLENDHTSIKFASKGLDMLNAKNSTYLYAHLLARVGISKFYLNDKHYMIDLYNSLLFLKVLKKENLFHTFSNSFKENHNINLEIEY